jgi:hypothetical protein
MGDVLAFAILKDRIPPMKLLSFGSLNPFIGLLIRRRYDSGMTESMAQ